MLNKIFKRAKRRERFLQIKDGAKQDVDDIIKELGLSDEAELANLGILMVRWAIAKIKGGYIIAAVTKDGEEFEEVIFKNFEEFQDKHR